MNPEAKLVSFMLRFVYEEALDDAEGQGMGWYGVIRHIQHDTERRFTRWADALAFIAEYIDLEQGRTE
jgi:hypothetical protein